MNNYIVNKEDELKKSVSTDLITVNLHSSSDIESQNISEETPVKIRCECYKIMVTILLISSLTILILTFYYLFTSLNHN